MLKKNVIGLDISDQGLKFVQMNEVKEIVSSGEAKLPAGVFAGGKISDETKFIESVTTLLDRVAPVTWLGRLLGTTVVVSLPDSILWSHSVIVPSAITAKEIKTYVTSEAAKIIPKDLSLHHASVHVTPARDLRLATFLSVEKSLLKHYVSVLTKAGYVPSFVGSSFYASARAILPREFGTDNFLVTRISETGFTIGAFDESAVAYIVIEGHTDASQKSEKLTDLTSEATKIVAHFELETQQPITKVILIGKPDSLKEAHGELNQILNLPVAIGDVSQNTKSMGSLKLTQALLYSSAIGLALCGVDKTFPHLNLLPKQFQPAQSFKLTSRDQYLSKLQNWLEKLKK